jgi:hypothetical protein
LGALVLFAILALVGVAIASKWKRKTNLNVSFKIHCLGSWKIYT